MKLFVLKMRNHADNLQEIVTFSAGCSRATVKRLINPAPLAGNNLFLDIMNRLEDEPARLSRFFVIKVADALGAAGAARLGFGQTIGEKTHG